VTDARVSGDLGGRLFVVATPIGNLGDVTHRALEILAAVPLVAAEDTRITRRLFARYGIRTPLTSFHARSPDSRTEELLAHLRAGLDLAVVTDAGTPGVSDPGETLVRAWGAEGGTVIPIPGPSAALAALVVSGVAGPRWSFEGFLPRAGRERRERLARIAGDDRTTIVFEAPGRVVATLADLAAACGEARPAAVCRELTKIHEETRRATLGELATSARAGGITLRGEFVIVVGAAAVPAAAHSNVAGGGSAAANLAAARTDVSALVAGGVARGEAARRVAASRGVPRRLLYEAPDRKAGSAR
jgi:16S rRNA (cytidine1402-2'-O)-methyltransferase